MADGNVVNEIPLWRFCYIKEQELAENIIRIKWKLPQIKLQLEEINREIERELETAELYSFEYYNKLLQVISEKKKNFPSNYPYYIVNPAVYANELFEAYFRKYLDGPKKILFVGMNPGEDGMTKTGVPFGNKSTVKEMFNINIDIKEEESGKRLWNYFKNKSGSIDNFLKKCFVLNFGPVTFFDEYCKTITQADLETNFKNSVNSECLRVLEDIVRIIGADKIVAIGRDVEGWIKSSTYLNEKDIIFMYHPSKTSFGNEKDWLAKIQNIDNLLKEVNFNDT